MQTSTWGITPRKVSLSWRTTSPGYLNILTRSRGSWGMEACDHLSGWHDFPMIFARGASGIQASSAHGWRLAYTARLA